LIGLLLCLIVGITDGDTITARCGEPGAYQQIQVRLAEIDAPERKQPFGTVSRQHLAALCFQEQATIKPEKNDRYGRTVGRVSCQGKDASVEQVRAGMAWAYTRYLIDPVIRDLEASAKSQGVGLWSAPEPIPPWEWRKSSRSPTDYYFQRFPAGADSYNTR
jgi:endonuclease YncB( thermonuclease family)